MVRTVESDLIYLILCACVMGVHIVAAVLSAQSPDVGAVVSLLRVAFERIALVWTV